VVFSDRFPIVIRMQLSITLLRFLTIIPCYKIIIDVGGIADFNKEKIASDGKTF